MKSIFDEIYIILSYIIFDDVYVIFIYYLFLPIIFSLKL